MMTRVAKTFLPDDKCFPGHLRKEIRTLLFTWVWSGVKTEFVQWDMRHEGYV